MTQKTENYWLFNAPVSKAIWHMAIPMMLGMSVNMIYNITDTFFIGKLNDSSALAAMTLLLPFMTILMAIGNLFGTGGSTLFSRLLGENNTDKTRQSSATTFWMAVIFGLLATIISVSFSGMIAHLIGADHNTFAYVKQYILFYGLGSPFVIANFTLEQLIRGEGESVQSMIGMVISVVLNIVLDPIFMFSFKLSIGGAALATVIGNMAAVIYYVICIKRAGNQITLSPKYFTIESTMLKQIFSVGFSAMLLDVLLIISSLMFNYYAVKYGDYVLAGFGISQKLVQIVDLVGMGLYMGVIPLIAVAHGAKDDIRKNEIIKETAIYLGVLITGLVFIMLLFKANIITIFSHNPQVIQIGKYILKVQLISSFFAGGAGLLTGIFQAEGKGRPAVIMSLMRGIIVIPALMIGDRFFKIDGVVFSLLVAEVVACLTGLVFYIQNLKK